MRKNFVPKFFIYLKVYRTLYQLPSWRVAMPAPRWIRARMRRAAKPHTHATRGRVILLLYTMDEKRQRNGDVFILKAWLSVLKDVQREYPRHTIDNAIMQIESRIKHLTQHD